MRQISRPVVRGDWIAVTGATGRIGQAVCQQLQDLQGYDLKALSRRSEASGLANPIPGDLASADFGPLLEDCAGLVHCAFAHAPGRYRGGEGADAARFWDLNITGSVRLLNQAQQMGVRRVVLFSSRAVFGLDQFAPGRRVDEGQMPQPDTQYGLQKQALEGLAQCYSTSDFTVAVLRPTGIYGGPAQTNKWRGLFLKAARGLLPEGNRSSTEVQIQTVAEAVACLLESEQDWIGGQVVNLSEVKVSESQILTAAGFDASTLGSPEPMNGPELTCARAERLGVRLKGLAALEQAAQDLRRDLQI